MENKNQPRLSVVQTSGELISVNPSRIAAARRMNRQKRFGAEGLAPLLGGGNDGRPSAVGDTSPLPPLLNGPGAFPDVVGHVGDGFPAIENFFEGFDRHLGDVITRDRLSRQGRTSLPVTKRRRGRTMRPMSRATTPTSFKKEFCQRLRAARIMRNLDQPTFAGMLGILPNTYGKYEKRSLLPHYLIPLACEILDISPSQLYPANRTKERSRGAA